MELLGERLTNFRLVTLTGPAGIGKTRLAVQFGRMKGSRYPDGVWLVELAAVKRAAGVAQALTAALSLTEEPGKKPLDRIAAHIADGEVLIILDNCEQVVHACAELADGLLRKCPRLILLCTSQEPLAIPGEEVWPVPPLALPDATGPLQLDAGEHFESVNLFLDRASASRSEFIEGDSLNAAVVEICRRLDGMPLAIELAAARTDAFSPAEILERLEDRFSFLTKGSRIAMPRHRTLRSSLEWSFDLLSSEEQVFLRRVSVFIGGFTVAAAEQVCADDLLPSQDIADLVSGLVAKSLVTADRRGSSSRHRLLETIRQFAAEKLAEVDEEVAVRARHSLWCLMLAEKERAAHVGGVPIGLQVLEAEHDNFRSALEWTISRGEQRIALELGIALEHFWHFRGHFSEGREWLQRALELAGEVGDDLRAAALSSIASLATVSWEAADPGPALEKSLALSQESDSTGGIARSLSLLGFRRLPENPDSGISLLKEAVTLARESGEPAGLFLALGLCGRGYLFLGDSKRARLCFQEGLELAGGRHPLKKPSDPLIGLGRAAMIEGEYSSAHDLLMEGLGAAKEAGEDYDLALSLSLGGEVCVYMADYERASELLDGCLRLSAEGNAPFPQGTALVALARMALNQSDLKEARKRFERALSVTSKQRGKYFLQQCVYGLGQIAGHEGDSDIARGLFNEALDLSRKAKNAWAVPRCLQGLGDVAREEDDHEAASALYYAALEAFEAVGDMAGAADGLEAVGGLASFDRKEQAARLFGAAEHLREKASYPRPALNGDRYRADAERARAGIAAKEFEKAWSEGGALSMSEAIAYCSRGRGSRNRPRVGWASLTPTEQQVVELVKEGLTNEEIGARMFITKRTVDSHLWRIFAKLDVPNRKELAKKAAHWTSLNELQD